LLYNTDVLFALVPSQRRAYLQQALKLIRSCAEKTGSTADGSKAFRGENIILCAEAACQVHTVLLLFIFLYLHY